MGVPKFGNVFSNEGKGSANDSGERRSGLTPEEIASRLYPKPTDAWRKDEPGAEAAAAEPTAVATADSDAAASDRNSPGVTADSPADGQVASDAGTAPLAVLSTPAAPESAPPAAPVERLVSVISRNSVFDGNYSTDGDVRVEGDIRGDITCKGHVLICDGATVNAKVSATSVSVAGRLSGEVTCTERFEAQPTARITSQISTPRLVIQDGAVVDGEIKMGVSE